MNQLPNWGLLPKRNVDQARQRPKACGRRLGGDDIVLLLHAVFLLLLSGLPAVCRYVVGVRAKKRATDIEIRSFFCRPDRCVG